MHVIKEYNVLVGSQVIQLATLLVLIYKQGMAVQLIDMPTRRYKLAGTLELNCIGLDMNKCIYY